MIYLALLIPLFSGSFGRLQYIRLFSSDLARFPGGWGVGNKLGLGWDLGETGNGLHTGNGFVLGLGWLGLGLGLGWYGKGGGQIWAIFYGVFIRRNEMTLIKQQC
jgi:hypothetical protein